MTYDRESKRWKRDVPLGRGDKGLSRVPFQHKDEPKRPKRNFSGKYSTLNKVGKKGKASARALKVFKKECQRQGVDERCERRGQNCTGAENLTWAHGRKRALLKEGELERFAIVCCVNCHRELDEDMSHDEMATEVARILNLRAERSLEAA